MASAGPHKKWIYKNNSNWRACTCRHAVFLVVWSGRKSTEEVFDNSHHGNLWWEDWAHGGRLLWISVSNSNSTGESFSQILPLYRPLGRRPFGPSTSFSLVALFSSLLRPSSKLGSKTRSDSHVISIPMMTSFESILGCLSVRFSGFVRIFYFIFCLGCFCEHDWESSAWDQMNSFKKKKTYFREV